MMHGLGAAPDGVAPDCVALADEAEAALVEGGAQPAFAPGGIEAAHPLQIRAQDANRQVQQIGQSASVAGTKARSIEAYFRPAQNFWMRVQASARVSSLSA
ncbi:MAG: hypothetical protein JWR00_2578 [Rubritepida sp.]|nr:hypothetical protein [Rubritepida sp.]